MLMNLWFQYCEITVKFRKLSFHLGEFQYFDFFLPQGCIVKKGRTTTRHSRYEFTWNAERFKRNAALFVWNALNDLHEALHAKQLCPKRFERFWQNAEHFKLYKRFSTETIYPFSHPLNTLPSWPISVSIGSYLIFFSDSKNFFNKNRIMYMAYPYSKYSTFT